jgi:hypothetical protein
MSEKNQKNYEEEKEELKKSIAELGFQVEETDNGELRVSQTDK